MPDRDDAPEVLNAQQVLEAYRDGRRDFHFVRLDGERLPGADLRGASFYGGSLRGVDLSGARLVDIQFKSADLTAAQLQGARLNGDLIAANFTQANLSDVDFTGACLYRANCTGADFSSALFNNCDFGDAELAGAKLQRVKMSHVDLSDQDVRVFCNTKTLRHHAPSSIDARTVMRSYTHPKLKQFMLDCGVPAIFAEYMIDCAKALDLRVIRGLMQSTFISYGTPDERFAAKLYAALRAHGVTVFFFPETATLGERLDHEIYRRIQEHDRVLLVCSRDSLNRTGVLNEIREVLSRETRDAGATYLLPITLDDYVFTGWRETQPELAERISGRIVGDFRGARTNKARFDISFARVLDALKTRRP